MPSKRVTQILRAKTDLSDEIIAEMTEAEAWQMVYSVRSPRKKEQNQICFTGFSPSEKDTLETVTLSHGFKVVHSVTQALSFLCIGPNAGPVKLQKAKEKGAILLTPNQLNQMLETGELPD